MEIVTNNLILISNFKRPFSSSLQKIENIHVYFALTFLVKVIRFQIFVVDQVENSIRKNQREKFIPDMYSNSNKLYFTQYIKFLQNTLADEIRNTVPK